MIKKRNYIEHIVDEYNEFMKTNKSSNLDKKVICGDFNDGNIIINKKDNKEYVYGIIDVGDCVFTYNINELAIGMAYAMIGPYVKSFSIDKAFNISSSSSLITSYDNLPIALQAAYSFYQGYIKIKDITNLEKEILILLIKCRLSISATIGAYSIMKDPHNDYLKIHAEPCWNAIKLLSDKKICQFFTSIL